MVSFKFTTNIKRKFFTLADFRYSFFILLICFSSSGRAQIVTIPDANFVAWLQINYPACITGNQLDTQCPDVLSADTLNLTANSISDLSGIEHFVALEVLVANSNLLTSLPPLPANLKHLECAYNPIGSIAVLPAGLEFFYCAANNLSSLPALPNGLKFLKCNSNSLTSLPTLPGSLEQLRCYDNLLTSLPDLPDSLIILQANTNNLNFLPDLPAQLLFLDIDYNPNLQCLPALPESLTNVGSAPDYYLLFEGTQITCIPNIPLQMWGTYPICAPGDFVNNPAACTTYGGIYGNIFEDTTGNCTYDSPEPYVNSVKMILLDDTGNQIGLAYSDASGLYHFQVLQDGNYTVVMDTSYGPSVSVCPAPGIDSLVSISGGVAATSVDFGLTCAGGPDLAATAIVPIGFVFPGITHGLKVYAGSAYTLANMTCYPTGGEVIVTISGPVTYNSPAMGALTPTTVSGNQLTYVVSDFSTINPLTAFNVYLETNTSAVIGDSVCVSVEIMSSTADVNLSNNFYQDCYAILNSYDPNMKTVYPQQVLPGYADWITYTIYFQNTGTAAAANIVLLDTLDVLLDENSFELLMSDHSVATELYGNNLIFKFDNIMLPDSASNPDGSKGFVQYRIKPQAGLSNGTIIENEAYIYFDYNAPVLTNTTTTLFIYDLGAPDHFIDNIIPHPNPGTGIFTFSLPASFQNETVSIFICNLSGEKVMDYSVSDSGLISLDLTTEKSGVYFMIVSTTKETITLKLVKY